MISKYLNSALYFGFLAWTLAVAFEVLDPPTYRVVAVGALAAMTIGLGNAADIRRLSEGVAGVATTFKDILKRTQQKP